MPHLHHTLRTPKSTSLEPRANGRTHRTHTKQAHRPAVAVLTILVLASLGLTACGGSSGSSTNAAASGSAATGTSGTSTTGGSSAQDGALGAGGRQRFSGIRECLQKNGITLPERTPGSGPPPGTSRLGLPKGVTAKQYEAAVKKCGSGRFAGAGRGLRLANSSTFKQALTKYAACLRQNAINIPAPNTSGKGPVFSTKGIDTASPKFKAATMKCRATLVGAFRSGRGSGGAAGTSTAPAGGGSSG